MADITDPSPLFFEMEVNDVLEREREGQKEALSEEEEKERRGCEWSVIEVKRVFVHIRVPNPTERMEEE